MSGKGSHRSKSKLSGIALLLKAGDFSAERHAAQRRKGEQDVPYVNHPLRVARYLVEFGGIEDVNVLAAALLHDTIEDTRTTEEELREEFGDPIADLVLEVTDDKSLPKAERKRRQIVHAPSVSVEATQIKVADKLSNVQDIAEAPPVDWTRERRIEYLDWTEKVVDALTNANPALLARYREALAEARGKLAGES
jgi:GTP diphosphokinase / guanosine-3',5'-bis(diphosphate) 3'-diphosphatase